MKPFVFRPALPLLLLSSIAASAATEETLNQRFSVQPSGTVVVEVDFGSVSLSTNATSEVVIDAWRKIGRKSKTDEEAFLRNNPITITQEGNTVTIRSHGKTRSSWSWSGRTSNNAKYTITVPPQFNARLKTGGGDITVAGLRGEVRADTGGGGVKAVACDGALTLRTGGGGIEVTSSSGSLNGKTGGGPVSVREFQGPVSVSTGGGGITIENVQGTIDASTGGGGISSVLTSEVADTVVLSTGGGSISVSAPAKAAFDLDARTGGGSVSSELPVSVVGKLESGHLQGPVNGGGKTVQLRSGGGGIRLKKLEL
jgi:hypothetical protein